MKYGWKNIEDQLKSGLAVYKYCDSNSISVSTFYKNRKKLFDKTSNITNVFISVDIAKERNIFISMNIDDHTVEFDSSLLSKIIEGLTLIVHSQFQMNVLDYSLFIFTNKVRNRIKILYYQSNGF